MQMRYLLSIIICAFCACAGSINATKAAVADFQNVRVYSENKLDRLYKDAAEKLADTIRQNPKAVILLPTGVTPAKMYKAFVEIYKKDRRLNLRRVRFFNLDNYVGLSNDHPLNYAYYMDDYFYGPLRAIDPARAPSLSNVYIPRVTGDQTPDEAALAYKKDLAKAVESNPEKTIDLAVLEVGEAYSVQVNNKTILRGGHIAFNEPGAHADRSVHAIHLTSKAKSDMLFRFSTLRVLQENGVMTSDFQTKVPDEAITLGIADILQAKEILALAIGENKAPVIENVFEKPIASNFPASYLQNHDNTHWLLDSATASLISYRPWQNAKMNAAKYPTKWLWRAGLDIIKKMNIPLNKVSLQQFIQMGIPAKAIELYTSPHTGETGLQALISDYQQAIIEDASPNKLPKDKKILIVSPHPDDDVICMSATIKKLLERGNDIQIVYVVHGENAVRDTLPAFQKLQQEITHKNPQMSPRSVVVEAKARVREEEAIQATTRLGVSSKNLHFFRAEYYYRRGVMNITPITRRDLLHMQELLLTVKPEVIFFAAEDDPHGANGLARKLVAQAVDAVDDQGGQDPTQIGLAPGLQFYGYRGAYSNWNLDAPNSLVIVPFDNAMIAIKMSAIRDHASQLNPLYPSYDPRPFYQRAADRNSEVAHLLNLILKGIDVPAAKMPAAELFYQFDRKEFLRRYYPSPAASRRPLPQGER
jgi:glucosamine-6-phosphate deaminase